MSLPTTLSSLDGAIALAEVALGSDRLVAIVDGPAKLVLPISGDVPPEGVLRIDSILLRAAGDEPARLLLATRRSGSPLVTEAELDHWWTMQDCHAGRLLALVEWLVFLDDGPVLSLAETAGPNAEWDQTPPPPVALPAEMSATSSVPPTAMRPAR